MTRPLQTAGSSAVGDIYGPALAIGLLLTMTAGFVDALGYVQFGQLYASFMSGNSTRLGTAFAAGNFELARWSGLVIAAFVVGAFFGTLLTERFGRIKLVLALACEIACLSVALGLSASAVGRATMLPIVVAMGLQNAIHQVVVGAATGKSFITGTLFSIGETLAKLLLGRGRIAETWVHCLTWAAFAGGVVLGATMLAWLGLDVALVLAATVLALLAVMAMAEHSLAGPQ